MHKIQTLKKVLEEFQSINESIVQKHFLDISELVANFDNTNILGMAKKMHVETLANADELLNLYEKKDIPHLVENLNPLEALLSFDKARPNEDDHSNLLLEILSSRKIEPLMIGLKSLLKLLLRKYPTSGNIRNVSKEFSRTRKESIKAEKRIRGTNSVIDLLISADTFAVYIENKMSFGKETINNEGEKQTMREFRDSNILTPNLEKENIVYIFINPVNISPSCDEFHLLNKYDMWDFFQNVSKGVSDRNFQQFLNYYSEYYLKYV
jgi:hypothetical protein